jgi:hypothetical protein
MSAQHNLYNQSRVAALVPHYVNQITETELDLGERLFYQIAMRAEVGLQIRTPAQNRMLDAIIEHTMTERSLQLPLHFVDGYARRECAELPGMLQMAYTVGIIDSWTGQIIMRSRVAQRQYRLLHPSKHDEHIQELASGILEKL